MNITATQLKKIEHYADRLFSEYNIDVNFQNIFKGTHFFDRLNDPRNQTPITVEELQSIFTRFSKKYGSYLMKFYRNYQGSGDVEAIIKDMHSDINMPFILEWNEYNGDLELRPKTIMRKHDFTSKGKVFALEMKLKSIYKSILKEQIGFYTLIPYIEQKLGIKIGKYVASGSQSDIFEVGSDKVLKITSGTNDANGMMLAKEHPDYPLPKIFGIYKIDRNTPNKKIQRFQRTLYVILTEKLKTDRFTVDQVADLEDWFLSNTKYKPDDIHPGNMGIRSDGTIIYLDPSFENAENNLSKIPTL